MTFNTSSILIVNDVEEKSKEIISSLPLHSTRLIAPEDYENFLITQAKLALKEAYISVATTKYIILCAARFSTDAQNALLKVLEEPPKNIIFIILTNSKTTILPTIFSRLQTHYLIKKELIEPCSLDIANLSLDTLYEFVKQNQRISKLELKKLIESMMINVKNDNIKLTKDQLDAFSRAIQLCDLNSRPNTILTTLLLNLMDK
jgi:DNA polymerase-3 subunit delta'